MEKKKVQRRKQGDHYNRNEIKIAIIEFILSNIKEDNEPGIPEPKIREHLQSRFGITDIENIRKHLKDLCEDKGKDCLKKFPYKKPGLSNHWDITKIEHLSNINNKFPSIQLNKYEKSLMTLLKKNGYFRGNPVGDEFYEMLRLSSSFFKACIDININELWKGLQRLQAFQKSSENELIKHCLDLCHFAYSVGYPKFKMSYESFVTMIIQMSHMEERYSAGYFLTSHMFIAETFMKIWEEELLGISKQTSNELHRESMEDDLQLYSEMAHVASMLKFANDELEDIRFYYLFDHYFKIDLFADLATDEEIVFALKIKDEYKSDLLTKTKTESNNENSLKLNDDDDSVRYFTRKKVKKLAKHKRLSP